MKPTKEKIGYEIRQALTTRHIGNFVNFLNSTGAALDKTSVMVTLIAMNRSKMLKPGGKYWEAHADLYTRMFCNLFEDGEGLK